MVACILGVFTQNGQDSQEGKGRYTTFAQAGSLHTKQTKVHNSIRERITSPLHVLTWEKGMASNPDRRLSQYICDGVRMGC